MVRPLTLCSCLLATAIVALTAAGEASATRCPQIVGEESIYPDCGPGWAVTARNYPTNIPPGATGTIEVDILNTGAGATSGPITVTDTLPPGVTAEEAGDLQGSLKTPEEPRIGSEFWECTGDGPGPSPHVTGARALVCTNSSVGLRSIPGGAGGPTVGNIENQNHQPELAIKVRVDPASPQRQVTNKVVVTGGGTATPASTEAPFTVSTTQPGFGLTGFHVWFSNADGTRDAGAGTHPYAATFSFDLPTEVKSGELAVTGGASGGEVRQLEVAAPPGLVGDATAVKQCTVPELNAQECPANSAIGFTTAYLAQIGYTTSKVFNMVPRPGTPAELAFSIEGINSFFDFSLQTGGDYTLTTRVNNIAAREIYRLVTTLWGVPADHSHDRWRSNNAEGCSEDSVKQALTGCNAEGSGRPRPFLTMPTSCGQPLAFSVRANSWADSTLSRPASGNLTDSTGHPYTLTGCENLAFGPGLTTTPSTSQTDSPTGMIFNVTSSLGGLQDPVGVSTSDLKNASVTLPAGLVINPGQAAGLQACSPEQSAVGTEDSPSCPPASKLGTVKVKSPLLEGATERELQGSVFLLQSNPPDLKLLVAASGDGINLKLVGKVHLDAATGQVQFVSFDGNAPPLPFTQFQLAFNEGPQAPLATPLTCGSYTTSADFTPWAAPFVADAPTDATLAITAGTAGGACPQGALPFTPSLAAGTSNAQAGAFASFSMHVQRADGQQRVEKLQFRSPAGLAALIAGVPLCDEANANAGTCPAASHIGHATVASGPGSTPLVLPQPGGPELPIYLTGPYQGAPFGLSIVTPVIAGPFNLGTIVTRAKIEVDPTTAQVTVTTDPLPQIVDGVPTDLRSIDAVSDRPGFFFNPTNCNPQEFTGTAASAGGAATAPLSSRFSVGGCRGLKFEPKFSATTAGAATPNGTGASFHVRLLAKGGPVAGGQASEANVKRVEVQLPKLLPARLTTLQKACTAAQFASNPAGCPEFSFVGSVMAHTPILSNPLTGPAILVSHGGAAFPDLVIVLQGEGVVINLVGNTQIKNGITYSRFETVPDAPISDFELNLPQSGHSALASASFNGFCGNTRLVSVRKLLSARVRGRIRHVSRTVKQLQVQPLSMGTMFEAQNGAVIKQNTPVTITGCTNLKAKKARRHGRHVSAKKRRRK